MSAVRLDDPQRDEKIRTISAKFDQMHVILRVLGVYDSAAFQRLVYVLNEKLRNKDEKDCREIFDNLIIQTLMDEQRLEKGFSDGVSEIFTYERFKGARNNWTNISKYLLMRIDRWLSQILDKPSYCCAPLPEIEERFNKSNRRRFGMHLEHIYAYNGTNRTLFRDPSTNLFDEAGFEQTRNLLGMVLLLKDSQNMSSSNDIYRDKLDDYEKSDIIWNQLLAGHLLSMDINVLPTAYRDAYIAPDPTGAFPQDRVEQRQRLWFESVKAIWADV
jgi:hypothetical protein